MPLITSFQRVATSFAFSGGGLVTDPGTWTPAGIPARLPNSLRIVVATAGMAKGGIGNSFTPAFVFPAGWTVPAGEPGIGNGSSRIAWVFGASVPAGAITWTVGPTPKNDIVNIAILEYLAGSGTLVRGATDGGPGNTPATLATAAAGFGNNMDEFIVSTMSHNDAHDPTTESWILAGSGGGWQQDYVGNGGSLGNIVLVGRRPYTNAGGSQGAVTITLTSPTLQGLASAAWNQATCGVVSGLCTASGAFILPPSGGAGGQNVPGGAFPRRNTSDNPGRFGFQTRTGRHF